MNKRTLRALLELDMHPAWHKADGRLVEVLLRAYRTWPASVDLEEDIVRGLESQDAQHVAAFLLNTIEQELQYILFTLRQGHEEYSKRYVQATTAENKRLRIMDYARELGASRRQLRQDRRAYKRRWFGHDAVMDRYLRIYAATERKIAFCLQRLGPLAAFILRTDGEKVGYQNLWRRLAMEHVLTRVLSYDGDSRVNVEAFRCLTTALRAMPRELQEGSVDEHTLQYIYRSALKPQEHVWIQCAALELLQSLSLTSLETVLKQRLTQPREGDELFVRRRAVMVLGNNLERFPTLLTLLPVVVHDPSPFVRQGLARALRHAPPAEVKTWLRYLAREDTVPQVRAAALLEILPLLASEELFETLLNLLVDVLSHEQDAFALRVACKVAVDGLTFLTQHDRHAVAQQWHETLLPPLTTLHQNAAALSVRRWVAQAREQLWCVSDPAARTLQQDLSKVLAPLRPGKRKRLPRRIFARYDADTVGRVLSVMSQQDFGYDVERRLFSSWITRGHHFGFRLWRLLHEVRNPSPDKRQAFRHTVGRIFRGSMRIPSGILSELAETKVPGEPFFIGTEAGWRPYLPLVDDVLSSLDHSLLSRPTRFFTSEGVTELRPPRFLVRRAWARAVLTWRFAHYARLRNWQEQNQNSPVSYLEALQRLGFRTQLIPYPSAKEGEVAADPAVTRFFPALLPLPFLSDDLGQQARDLWLRMQDYFFSAYENSLLELSIFMGLAMVFFLGRHIYANYQVRAIRHRLPLSLGGWGTRGKSGTERLKAAILNALGYSLVSKTTGCEAMFLYGYPYGEVREMFLFRPYDKATIWEQLTVMQLADNLHADVFLWECMALNPSFVKLLQRQWVRDDIATLTNTYPDHEDIQGPAGINLPEVMTNFIPKGTTVITSEEQMCPVLRDAAPALGTKFLSVGWLEAGLLTPDVLQRFPYEEHPFNIALVLSMADELGVDNDFALKEMADRVVADLGVLKAYPTAPMRSRTLEFVNGMSANERFGCLGNWTRMAFDRQDPEQESGVWLSTVVNNRSDRVSRSRVFAGIITADISADRHFLIGSNLKGLQGYVQEAWQAYVQAITLWPAAAEPPLEVLQNMTRRLRMPASKEQVMARLRAMLQGHKAALDIDALVALWRDPPALSAQLASAGLQQHADAIVAHVQRDSAAYDAYRAFAERAQGAGTSPDTNLDEDFRDLLSQWYNSKIVVIENYHASGDEVVERICEETPPGFHNRIMGLQNIKGTGLDFVYRWQAWETCYAACRQLGSLHGATAEQGLRALASFHDYGFLSAEYVPATLNVVKQSPVAQNESFQAQLMVIAANLEAGMEKVRAHAQTSHSSSGGGFAKAIELLEAFLDAGDAVQRRKRANRIYKDLAAERISHARAAKELQGLNKRQKGGWLLGQWNTLQARFTKASASPTGAP